MATRKPHKKTARPGESVRGLRWGALLCALRRGQRSTDDLAAAVGDARAEVTSETLREMARAGHVGFALSPRPGWILHERGVAYLASRGVGVS